MHEILHNMRQSLLLLGKSSFYKSHLGKHFEQEDEERSEQLSGGWIDGKRCV